MCLYKLVFVSRVRGSGYECIYTFAWMHVWSTLRSGKLDLVFCISHLCMWAVEQCFKNLWHYKMARHCLESDNESWGSRSQRKWVCLTFKPYNIVTFKHLCYGLTGLFLLNVLVSVTTTHWVLVGNAKTRGLNIQWNLITSSRWRIVLLISDWLPMSRRLSSFLTPLQGSQTRRLSSFLTPLQGSQTIWRLQWLVMWTQSHIFIFLIQVVGLVLRNEQCTESRQGYYPTTSAMPKRLSSVQWFKCPLSISVAGKGSRRRSTTAPTVPWVSTRPRIVIPLNSSL